MNLEQLTDILDIPSGYSWVEEEKERREKKQISPQAVSQQPAEEPLETLQKESYVICRMLVW